MSTVARPDRASRQLRRGRLLVLLTGVLWSLAGIFIKSLDLHPLTITLYRSFFASAFFFFFFGARDRTASVPLLASALSYTTAISSFVWANKLTTAANAIILQYTAPIFVFIFARLLFRETISKINLTTLLVGMAGVGIIFGGSATQPDATGVMLAILSGFLFSLYMTNLRYLQGVNPAYLTFANNLACSLALLPLAPSFALSSGEALTLAVMGVVQLGIPYFLFSKGLEAISLQEASLIVLVEPVLNPIWVAIAFREVPSTATLVGGGVILSGLGFRYVWLLRKGILW